MTSSNQVSSKTRENFNDFITPESLYQKLDSDKNITIIDVRETHK